MSVVLLAEISASGDDDDDEGEHGHQIKLPGIVTAMADFPAHCLLLPSRKPPDQCGPRKPRVPGGRSKSRARAPLTPRHRPNRHGKYHRAPGGSGQRHVVDSRCAPGLAAQQPRQRHPAAAPQAEIARSPRRHRPSKSADAGNCIRPAATGYAGRSRSSRAPRCAAGAARLRKVAPMRRGRASNASWAGCCDHGHACAPVPEHGTGRSK